ncbi:Gfo/Idh/MocA family oxidoreductase [Nocardia sp. CDC159]|uniref:Gfo/Idh/MocA family oxidoreductase n=1 Tax=Nocardia pulmonis TaxID=2951408 RepID=A0A9X2EBW3_9NOCA|nr:MULTISPECIES: Gfo/Idh/MocA family oxidoreductase [Nocardia]MCM6775318.1 Gfo/Idh/MocA family oxidoreductase [Nocardia pulmonis]MCM6787948.1 Gfo/Idh/MocA family oxidoreductase [Nocardia sp. CDC159]
MTERKIRWGILATGSIAHAFVKDLRLLPDAEVVAVASRTEEAAHAFAAEHGIARAYGAWSGLAGDPDVDVVYVATPHPAHHAASALCLEAGKAVLCEKPLTLDAERGADLVRIARDAGVFLMEAMWTRCVPAILALRESLAAGVIGEPRLVHADFSVDFGAGPGHRVRDPKLGGGSLLDVGIYALTIARLVFGAPDSITARATLTPEGVDETSAITLGHPGGGVAVVTSSIAVDGPCSATVSGTEGRIELGRDFFAPSGFHIWRGGERVECVETPLIGRGMAHEALEVHQCLRKGLTESPLVPLAETLGVLRTMDEIRAGIGVAYPP